jgi:hypothetical protein
MSSTPQTRSRRIRKVLSVSALALVSAVTLAACGQPVEHANLGRCTNLPASGGSLCEEIGGDYIFVDSFTRSMRRIGASQARLILQTDSYVSSAQAVTMAGSPGGQRNCLANPGIACSGALNNRVTGYRSGGSVGVCSGSQCLSMSR